MRRQEATFQIPSVRQTAWICVAIVSVAFLASEKSASSDEPSANPKPIPQTRPELKAALEALKERRLRIALPASTSEEQTATYLPASWGGDGVRAWGPINRRPPRDRSGRALDPRGDALFTDPSFWVVSRANNCHYCLGHQELKLGVLGFDDDAIGALDGDWALFQPEQRTILEFARKLTLEPYGIGNADIATLARSMSDAQIIELTFDLARFNAVNRWTDAMGFPQEQNLGDDGASSLDGPTSPKYQRAISQVTPTSRFRRPPVPSWQDLQREVARCRRRPARVKLADATSEGRPASVAKRGRFRWELALATIPGEGPVQVARCRAVLGDDHLGRRLKAELALATALTNHTWYSAAHAAQRLIDAGATTADVEQFAGRCATGFSPSDPAHQLALKLTSAPHLVADADVAAVQQKYGDRDAALILHVIATANFFDRFTEALGLSLERDVLLDIAAGR